MSVSYWFAAAALMLPLAATAQQNTPAPEPTDPRVTVPPQRYVSVFDDYQPLAAEQETPSEVWREVNQEVGKLGGHVGHLGDDTRTSSAADPAMPSSPAGHDKHH